jgi:hypothetical protein
MKPTTAEIKTVQQLDELFCGSFVGDGRESEASIPIRPLIMIGQR